MHLQKTKSVERKCQQDILETVLRAEEKDTLHVESLRTHFCKLDYNTSTLTTNGWLRDLTMRERIGLSLSAGAKKRQSLTF